MQKQDGWSIARARLAIEHIESVDLGGPVVHRKFLARNTADVFHASLLPVASESYGEFPLHLVGFHDPMRLPNVLEAEQSGWLGLVATSRHLVRDGLAVDRSSQATHQCGYFATDRKLPAGAGLHDADTLDTADLGRFGPFSFAHVHLCVIDPEFLSLYDDVAGLRFRLGHLLDDQAVETRTEVIDNDGSHGMLPSSRN